jgi:hypothetical protein
MAVTLNASTSAGLISSADTSGILQLQTANTTALTIDASQNVGVGTSSPARQFVVYGSFPCIQLANATSGGTSNDGLLIFQSGLNAVISNQEAGSVSFETSNTERMRLDASGNLALGATSANQRLEVVSSASPFARFRSTASAFTGVDFGQNNAGAGVIDVRDNQPLILYTNDTERARIDSSGNLLVGTTVMPSSSFAGMGYNRGSTFLSLSCGATTTSVPQLYFTNGNGTVGSISTSGSATAYNTSSDYRLKNTIAPMTGALAKVAQLKPCTYKWNQDGSDGEGFIAHELAQVVPQCVSGEKDAIDAEGNPQYQGIDVSFLVATLTAAIQEQQTIIESLTQRITALEGA